MSRALVMGLLLGCTLCGLAGLPHPAAAKVGGIPCTCAMTVCGSTPVVAFTNWGAGPLGVESALVIASPGAVNPADAEAWQFHLVHPGLGISRSYELDEGMLALFPAGDGVALVAMAQYEYDKEPGQIFAAWSPGVPCESADWIISPTGIVGGGSQVAGAATADYIALMQLHPHTPDGYRELSGLHFAVAPLPLTGSYDDWRCVCVQPASFPSLPKLERSAKFLDRDGGVSLCAGASGIYLTCSAVLLERHPSGLLRMREVVLLGRCADPQNAPERWDFTAIDEGVILSSRVALSEDGTQVYVTYSKFEGLTLAQCPAAQVLDPAAWRRRKLEPAWMLPALACVDNGPGVAVQNFSEQDEAPVNYFAEPRGPSGVQHVFSHIPVGPESLSLASLNGRPAVCGYDRAALSLSFAWAKTRTPSKETDWRNVTIWQGDPAAVEPPVAADGEPEVLRDIFTPPPPEIMAQLQAGAIPYPPRFKWTWLSALLATALAALIVLPIGLAIRRRLARWRYS